MLKTCSFCLLALFVLSKADGSSHKISAELLAILENGERADVVVSFVNGVQRALDKAATLQLSDRITRNQAIVDELRALAEESQDGVVQMLTTPRIGIRSGFKDFKQYWLGNNMVIQEANLDTILAVAEDPQVLKIENEIIVEITKPVGSFIPFATDEDGMTKHLDPWGLKMIQVKEAWEEMGGNKGEGALVGTIDTGVSAGHEALRDNFVGVEYGWFDAAKSAPQPVDEHGHGTHTMGTIVGNHSIGVAPGAKWMHCRACDTGSCNATLFRDCLQWMACPTLANGSNPDCSKAPHVVSNSWGFGRGDSSFQQEILIWRALGIIPVFAIGNGGSMCDTSIAPGEFPFVIGVGATNEMEYMARWSSVGNASDGGLKPDIAAPGERVLSSLPFGRNSTYGYNSGSSMAAPHVAGVVALLVARDLDITYDQVYDLLTQNTDQELAINPEYEETSCKNGNMAIYPNIFAGHGRVNALKAVQAQTQMLSNWAST